MNHQTRRLSLIAAIVLSLLAVSTKAQSPNIALQGTEAPSVTDGVDIFSGKLEQILPLLNIKGRGEIAQGLYLPLRNTEWRVFETSAVYTSDRVYRTYRTDQMNYVNFFARAGYQTLGLLEVETKYVGWYIGQTKTVTEVKFTSSSGSMTHFRDVLTGGEPYDTASRGCIFSAYQPPPNPPPPACSRGRVFRAIDGSNATFVADADIYDMLFQDVTGPSPYQGQNNIAGTIFLNNGTHIRIQNEFNNVTSMTDRNGNVMKLEYVTEPGYTFNFLKKITDSLNREITIVYGDTSQPSFYDEIVYKGFAAAERRIRINYTGIGNVMLPGQSLGVALFPAVKDTCNLLSDGSPCNPNNGGTSAPHYATSLVVPSSIVLPNGKQYQFFYNNYLELARIKSPTGSYTDYSYGGVIGADGDGVSGGGTEIYRRVTSFKMFDKSGQLVSEKTFSNIPQYVDSSHPSYPLLDNVTIDTKDGSGTVLSKSRHYFYDSALMQRTYTFLPMLFGREHGSEVLDPVSQAVLRRTDTTWEQRQPFQWCLTNGVMNWIYFCDGSPNSGPPVDPRITEVKTTLETGQVTKKTFSYDQYNNVTDSFDYDFGQGTSGPLLRRTHTDYVTASSYIALGVNLLNLPARVSVYDSNDIERGRVAYEYDNYASDNGHAGLANRPGISGLDAASTISYGTRGNPTAATRYLLTNGTVTGSITGYTQYDIAGNLVKVIDPNGCTTTVDFTDHFGGPNGNTHANSSPVELASVGQASYAFASSATNCLGQISYMKFDYYTSRPVDTEDANGIISSAYSSDPLDRLTKMIHAVNTSAQNQTVVSYDDTDRTITTSSDLNTNTDGALVSKQYFDSFGRPVESREYEGGTNYTVVQQQYDDLGRAHRVSNPYRPWQGESAKWTENAFDTLGRVISVTSPDTAVARTAYNGSQTLATDQIGKQRMSQTNALGQVKEVWEITAPDSMTEPVSFPAHNEVTAGYYTSYAYDVLDDLITVTQGTQSPRTFVYDSIGRVNTETTPERGTIAYQYDNVGNLLVKTDARGVSTHFSYDGLNRQVRRWYNSSNSVSATNQNSPALPPDLGTSDEVRFFYDAQVLPAGAPVFARGPSTGLLVATTYGSGSSAGDYYGYDAGGGAVLKIQQTGGVNYQVTITHNAAGIITSQVYPSGHTVSYALDAAGRPNSFAGNLGDGTQRNYSTGISYSALGGLSQEQFGTATPIYNKIFYNVRGQLAEIREGLTPNDTTWERGAIINFYSGCWGMCAGQPMPDNNGTLKRQENWVPDGSGNVLAVNGQAFEYDSLNRIKRVSEGTAWQQQFIYDRHGNRTVDTNNTTASLSPQAFEVQTSTNRLLAPGDTNLAEPSRRMRYDAAGNLTTDNYTGQGQRAYDADNHMTSSAPATYSYDSGGHRVRRNISGVETWQVYGFGGELIAEYAANAGASTPQKEYGYRNGELLIIAGTGATTAPAPSSLTAAPSSGGGNVILSWSAAAGATNYRVERKGASGSFTLVGTTASTGLTDTGVSAGSAYLFRVCAASAQGNCASPFSNIALGAAVSFPTDPNIISSADDPTGVNVTKVKAAHITELRTAVNAVRSLAGLSAGQWTNQTLTATVTVISADDVRDLRTKLDEALTALGIQTSNYDDQTLAGSPNGTVIKKVHITQLRLRATSGTGGPGGTGSSAFSVQWLVTDQLGTPRMVFDETGSLTSVKRHDYLPFGEELFAGARATTPGYGGADGVRQKFTGYEHDAETGLEFAQARYYAGTQGRFTSPDPSNGSMSLPDPQSMNRYAYVENNPLVLTDPSGLNIMDQGFLDFWGDMVEYLPGFGTKFGSFASQAEQRYQSGVEVNAAFVRANADANKNSGGDHAFVINISGVEFFGYFDDQGILTWWTGKPYELPNENVEVNPGLRANPQFSAENGDAMSRILTVGSTSLTFASYRTVSPFTRAWRGMNGGWYRAGWGGNGATGSRSLAIENAGSLGKFGRLLGAAGYTYSGIQTVRAYRQGGASAAVKPGFDTLFGVAGTHGGPWGAGAGAVYFGVDMTIGWPAFYKQSVEHPIFLGQPAGLTPLLF